jgi:hypothetical protein
MLVRIIDVIIEDWEIPPDESGGYRMLEVI